MRLSNAWRKLKFAVCVAVGVALLVVCVWQLWSAWADGAVKPFARGMYDWVTFQSSPGWFLGSVIGYLLSAIIVAGLFTFAWIESRTGWRWRTRQDLDTAVRQTPEQR